MFKKYLTPAIIGSVLVLHLFLGIPRIASFSAVDEPYWTYDRIPRFWSAVADQRWKSTDINDKPGITAAALGGFGLFSYDPMQYKALREKTKTPIQLAEINDINFHFRLPSFIFGTFALLLYYFFLRKLFDPLTAILGFIFIGLSPIIFGMSLLINVDALLWVLVPLSLLSYFIFKKDNDRRYLWSTGILLGLSLLTKFTANILIIFFFFLPFLEYIVIADKPDLTRYLKNAFKQYLAIIAIAFLTMFVLWPAAWVKPKVLLNGTFLSKAFETTWPLFVAIAIFIVADIFLFKNALTRRLLDTLSTYKTRFFQTITGLLLFGIAFTMINTYLGMRPMDLLTVLASPKGIGAGPAWFTYSRAISADLYGLVFGLSPLVLLAFLWALVRNMRERATYSQKSIIVLSLSVFMLLYYFGSTVDQVIDTVRYQIIIYPIASIIAAIGFASFISTTKIKKFLPTPWAVALITLLILPSLLLVRPFYFAYASSLLPQKYLLNYKDMGDGSYEAADYLNKLPDPQNLSIWSDKGAVCAVFRGDCTIGFNRNDLEGKHFDYFVISVGRLNRSSKLSGGVNNIVDFKKIYSSETPSIYNLTINGRPENFVKIIDASALAQ
ncbi:MAG: glycosyltransferase family 39 protein [Candidatus Moraniibacteriota bacterium]